MLRFIQKFFNYWSIVNDNLRCTCIYWPRQILFQSLMFLKSWSSQLSFAHYTSPVHLYIALFITHSTEEGKITTTKL